MFYYSMPPTGAGPAVRPASVQSPTPRGLVRRLLRPALALITLVLVADALIGENGFFAHMREVRRQEDVRRVLEQTQDDNRALRERARRLRERDAATIEELARRRLGLVKPGEVLFIITEGNQPAADAARAPSSAAEPR